MTQQNGQIVRYALVQYRFKGNEHKITRPPHKSSKSSTPYKRIYPSTIIRLKEVAKEHKPSATFEQVDSELDVGLGSNGKLSRNKKQVSHVQKSGDICQLSRNFHSKNEL